MWFDSWNDIGRTVLVGSAAYITLVVVLRVSGKRTLSQLNAFDFVVTVALGSTLATILLSTDVSWSEGFAAFAVLVCLQLGVALVSARWPAVRAAVTSAPVILVSNGVLHRESIRRNRLTESEIRQAVRGSGTADLSQVGAVVLETDGTLSVIPAGALGQGWALGDVRGWPGEVPRP